MSSLQSLRELISERLAAAAEEIFRLCEGTIVQYEQELCRQRRLLDICWKPQLQLHPIVLPHHHLSEEQNNQQRNFGMEQDQPEPPQIEKELDELELPQIKEEQVEFSISQDEEQLNLKRETETLTEIPTYEENENSKADLNNQQNFNVMDRQDEEGNQHEESTSTPDEESDPQNRDQRKRTDRSHVQSVASSHMSESLCDSDVRKNLKKETLVKQYKQSPKENGLSYIQFVKRTISPHNLSVYRTAVSDERQWVCKECGMCFSFWSLLRVHMETHEKEKRFSCKECDKSFNHKYLLKAHMRIHTGEKPFICKECNRRFSQKSYLRRHVRIHTGEKPYFCKECDRRFSNTSNLKTHMKIHARTEKLFSWNE